MMSIKSGRRDFLSTIAVCGAAAAGSMGSLAIAQQPLGESHEEPEISAPEDLMREHGVLNRILLIYEEAIRRLQGNEDVPPEVFQKPANLVRTFVEDYHEKLEENFIFPRFEEKHTLTELVGTLREQHQAGRRLTDLVLHHAAPQRFGDAAAKRQVIQTCDAFIRMYRPHEAREDTVLFPALYEILPPKRVKELGEQFEEQEHTLFGEEGFEKAVEEVATIEKQLGIYDLAQFTPK